MSFYADLHAHSNCSDGTFSPIALADLALSKNFKGISITDHDTVASYDELIPYAKEKGLEVLTGVEFSCIFQNHSIHLLGYGFDLKALRIIDLIERHKKRRTDRNKYILEKLEKLKLPILESDLPRGIVIGRPHIATAMIAKGYVENMQEAFKKYLGEGKSAFHAGDSILLEETIEAIHSANGYAILAHPHLISPHHLLEPLFKLPIDGIESRYSLFKEKENNRCVKRALKRNWIETAGSDFHGVVKPYVPYGTQGVTEETFNRLCKPRIQN